MEMEALRLGRVNRRIEKSLGKAYSGSTSVTITEPKLRKLIEYYPERYLSALEKMKEIIALPQYGYSKCGNIYLIRSFITKKGLRFWSVGIKEEGFSYVAFGPFGDKEYLDLVNEGIPLVGIQ